MLNRRSFIGGAGLMTLMPGLLRADSSGTRSFRVLRDGSDIGSHVISVKKVGADIQVAIDIELKVKVIGITAYRYEMQNREVWRDGKIVSVDCSSNDDGDAHFCRVKPVGDEYEVEGSVWSGTVPGDSVTTTYWSYDFLKSPLWISTADGDPLKVAVSKVGAGEIPGPDGPVATEKWAVGGDMDIDLHYIDREWVSVRFDAGGENAIYQPDSIAPVMRPVWFGS